MPRNSANRHLSTAGSYDVIRVSTQGLVRMLIASILFVCQARGQEEPIYESEPFDIITLTPKYKNETFRIYPLEIPANPDPTDLLRVRLLKLSDRFYDIAWKDIAKVERFPDLLLAKANELIDAKLFDDAYHHLAFLRKEYPDVEGLETSIGNLVFQDAGNAYRSGDYAEALSLLDEVRRVDPSRASLLAATENVAKTMFKRHVEAGNYSAALAMISWAKERFGRKLNRTIGDWERQLADRAATELERAQRLAAEGNFREAYEISRQAVKTWPDLPGLSEFATDIATRYPVVRVGVTRPALNMDPRRAEDWAARRTGRLRYRTLVEIEGYGPDGGEYLCPVGSIHVSADSRELTIELKQGDTDSIANLFTGYDLANILLDMARPGGPNEVPLWSQLVESISVQHVYKVNVRLSQPVLNPVSLLQTPLSQLSKDDSTGPTNPYSISYRDSGQLRLIMNPNYVARRSTQPKEIVEVYFDDPAAAVDALVAGDVDVVDRLFPGDVRPLRRRDDIRVQPYAVPSIHFLVPNFRRPLMNRRAFRRALVYGISRKTILKQDLLGNTDIQGCRLISGPFPPGIGSDDPLGYAYSERIKPRGYEPALALTLAEVARGQWKGMAEKSGQPPPKEEPLVLVHPAAAVPRIASAAIAQYLTAIGIACNTRELRAGEIVPRDDDWDLVYVDMVVTEPMFDVRQLLGANGLIHGGSSYLELALRRLGWAASWEQSRETLHEIHRLAHEEVAVVPLWQLSEFFAYNTRLRNVGEYPLSLYQGVEDWQILPVTDPAGNP